MLSLQVGLFLAVQLCHASKTKWRSTKLARGIAVTIGDLVNDFIPRWSPLNRCKVFIVAIMAFDHIDFGALDLSLRDKVHFLHLLNGKALHATLFVFVQIKTAYKLPAKFTLDDNLLVHLAKRRWKDFFRHLNLISIGSRIIFPNSFLELIHGDFRLGWRHLFCGQ